MLTRYNAMMDAAKVAVESADAIQQSAASVVVNLKAQRQAMQEHRELIMKAARERADFVIRDASATVDLIGKMQDGIDAMIAQIEGASPVAVAS